MANAKTRRFIHETYSEEGRLKDKEWFLYIVESKVTMQFKVMFLRDDIDRIYDSKDKDGRPYMAYDIGFHSPKPKWDGHKPMDGHCSWTGGDCFYDGTSLGAQQFAQFHGIDDNEVIFKMLQKRYDEWFGDVVVVATPLEQLRGLVKEADDE